MNIEIATSSLVATGDSLTEGWGVTPRSLLAYRAVYETGSPHNIESQPVGWTKVTVAYISISETEIALNKKRQPGGWPNGGGCVYGDIKKATKKDQWKTIDPLICDKTSVLITHSKGEVLHKTPSHQQRQPYFTPT